MNTLREDLGILSEWSRQLLAGCEKIAPDGTVLYTPDGVQSYDALWLRDLGYMAEYCGDLMGAERIEACIEFALAGQREDGWLPDRVEASGEPVYAAGAKGFPVGKANLDNTPFLIFAVTSWLELPDCSGLTGEKLQRWTNALQRGMDCIPLSEDGLVYNDPEDPHSPYGFTDTVCKTGRLFYESLLYWRACRQLSQLLARNGLPRADEYAARAAAVETALYDLYDPESGLFFAADGFCRQLDVWGAAFLLYIGFPVKPEVEEGLRRWLVDNQSRYLYRGQICHLPDGAAWEKLLIQVEPGEYQNGAYWATASGWVWYVLKDSDPDSADRLLKDLIQDFEEGGICECVNRNYRKLPEYVVSGTNIRGPVFRWSREHRAA